MKPYTSAPFAQYLLAVIATPLLILLQVNVWEATGQEGGGTGKVLTHMAAFPGNVMDLADPKTISLPRLDGVHVGHARSIRVPSMNPDGSHAGSRTRTLVMRTISMTPLVFEIEHFLTSHECKLFRDNAKGTGLEEVVLSTDGNPEVLEDHTRDDVLSDRLAEIDSDGNEQITLHELQMSFQEALETTMPLDEIEIMINSLEVDSNNDGILDIAEFRAANVPAVISYVRNYHNTVPGSRRRFLHQATFEEHEDENWLSNVRKRIAKVTEIPESFVKKSEPVQVIRYTSGGFAQCHLDSADPFQSSGGGGNADGQEEEEQADGDGDGAGEGRGGLACCTFYSDQAAQFASCRKCRYATVLMYLTDVADGGQTAFPAANVTDINVNESRREEFTSMTGRHNLVENCGGLTVKPERGKALLWYSHLAPDLSDVSKNINNNVGPLDHSTLRGSCQVHRGDKWVVNNWINYEFYHGSPPDGYGSTWGMEADAPKPPSPARQIFQAIVSGEQERMEGSQEKDSDTRDQPRSRPKSPAGSPDRGDRTAGEEHLHQEHDEL
eukprot:scpid51806/ scgid11065/ Transmembrane prolyl 4-hydroxylase; Hypoxia-inducible factor prolyl hydroxylase 4